MSTLPEKYVDDCLYEIAEPLFKEMVPDYQTTGAHVFPIFSGHDGRVLLDVKPESESIIHRIYVVYRNPTEADRKRSEEWKAERKRCGEESRCPPFLSTGRTVTTASGNTCFLIQVGEGSWEARYLDKNGAAYGQSEEQCLKHFDEVIELKQKA